MEAGSVEHSLKKFGCKGDMSGEDMSRVFCSFHKLFVYVMKLIERIQEPEIENRGRGRRGEKQIMGSFMFIRRTLGQDSRQEWRA